MLIEEYENALVLNKMLKEFRNNCNQKIITIML